MIDTQYSLAATQAAIPSEPIAPGAAGRSVGTPRLRTCRRCRPRGPTGSN